MKKQLILIGGIPGSGKTYIGRQIAQQLGLFIDKDTICEAFTGEILKLRGSHPDDRESYIYLENVRDVEYKTMISHALENIALGHTVICCAPFIKEFDDSQWLDNLKLEAKLLNAEIFTIWIYVDFPTAYSRIFARDTNRDTWKLANWDAYTKSIPQTSPPRSNSITIDNSRYPKNSILEQIENVIQALKTKKEVMDIPAP